MKPRACPKRLPALIGMLLALACAAALAQDSGSTLETFGYDSTRAGVERCLTDMVWTPAKEAEYAQCVVELDSDDFGTRDNATATLTLMPSLPHDRLRLEFQRQRISVEKRRRILQVLEYNTALRRELILYLAAKAITVQRHKGLAPVLIHAANSVPVTQRGVWDAARTAMVRTVTSDDAAALRNGIGLAEPTARAISCEGLAALEGRQALEALRPLLTDPDPRVRFHAALAFKSLNSPECVPALISLLDTTLPDAYQKHDTHIRFNSVEILKKLTGKRFGYRAGFAPDVRRAYIERWQSWLEAEGATATLDFHSATSTHSGTSDHPSAS